MRAIERLVLGSDYGATSWTTRCQADRLAELLSLGPGMRLLDVGAGSGWPALYLADSSGCEAVLTDVALVGLQIAVERAALDGLAQRCGAVAAHSARLPFHDGSFDCVSHSDVLCCLPDKLETLQECRRIAKIRAPMVFTVIEIVPGLSASEFDCALRAGPPFVDAGPGYETLLRHAGWQLVERIDVTAEFVQSLRVSLATTQARREALIAALGASEFGDRAQRRQAALAALAAGVLKREIFVARAAVQR